MTDRIWTRAASVLWRRSLDSVIVMGEHAAEPIMLSGTGSSVWELLASPIEHHELVATLADTFCAAIEDVDRDIAGLLDALELIGAIELLATGALTATHGENDQQPTEEDQR